MFELEPQNEELFRLFESLEGSLLLKASFLVKENLGIAEELNILPQNRFLEENLRIVISGAKRVLRKLQESDVEDPNHNEVFGTFQTIAGLVLMQRATGALAVLRIIHSVKKGDNLLRFFEDLPAKELLERLSGWKVDTSNEVIDSFRERKYSGFVGDLVEIFDMNLQRMDAATGGKNTSFEVVSCLEALALVQGALMVLSAAERKMVHLRVVS